MRYDHEVLTELDQILDGAAATLALTQQIMHHTKGLPLDKHDILFELSEDLAMWLANYDKGVGMTAADRDKLRRHEDHCIYLLQWLEDAA